MQDEDATVLGEQHLQHARVLHRDGAAEARHHTGWQLEVETHRVGVSGSGATTGADQDVMVLGARGNLVYERIQRGSTAIHHRLATHLHDFGVRQDPVHLGGL